MSKTKLLLLRSRLFLSVPQHRKSNLHSSGCSDQISVSFVSDSFSVTLCHPTHQQVMLVLPSNTVSPHLMSLISSATLNKTIYNEINMTIGQLVYTRDKFLRHLIHVLTKWTLFKYLLNPDTISPHLCRHFHPRLSCHHLSPELLREPPRWYEFPPWPPHSSHNESFKTEFR